MSNNKTILDIRYYESSVANLDGFNPQDLGKLLKLPASSTFTAARIARKLRELGFKTGGDFDHVYINFTSAEPAGKIAFAQRSIDREDAWLRYVDVGVCFSEINRLSSVEKSRWLDSITLQVIQFLARRDSDGLKKIQQVQEQIQLQGEDLSIVLVTKDTKSYSVCVSYRIANKPSESSIWVEYIDHKSKTMRRGVVAKLHFYEDVYSLVSSVRILDGKIQCKPRSSFKAKLYNKKYKVPLSVEIASLPVVDEQIRRVD